MTILAALLCVAALGAGGWLAVAGVRALKVRVALAVGCGAVAVAVFLFAAGLLRYIVAQVKGGFTFIEKISIDDTAVHYVYRDIEGEKFWSEPLSSFAGVQVLGFRAGRPPAPDLASSTLVLKSLPKSTGTAGSDGGPGDGFRWVVMLMHPALKKCIRLLWDFSTDGAVSADLAQKAQEFSERFRVPMLPPHLPVGLETAS